MRVLGNPRAPALSTLVMAAACMAGAATAQTQDAKLQAFFTGSETLQDPENPVNAPLDDPMGRLSPGQLDNEFAAFTCIKPTRQAVFFCPSRRARSRPQQLFVLGNVSSVADIPDEVRVQKVTVKESSVGCWRRVG